MALPTSTMSTLPQRLYARSPVVSKPCCPRTLHSSQNRSRRVRAADGSFLRRNQVIANALQVPSSPSSNQGYAMSEGEEEEYAESCSASLVSVDQKAHEKFTVMSVDVADYPGLLRTITWVLNGMGMRVQNASLSTDDGWAHDVFWLSTWAGNKLTDKQATLLAERVQDFVVFCEPKPCIPTEWGVKSIHVSNVAHPQWTVLTVEGEPERQGFLLELASVLSGTGAHVREAYIQSEPIPTDQAEAPSEPGATPHPVAIAPPGYDFKKGRFFKFLLSDRTGAKLDASRIGAILFTYDVFTDAKHMPLVAPNMDTYLRQKEQEQGCI